MDAFKRGFIKAANRTGIGTIEAEALFKQAVNKKMVGFLTRQSAPMFAGVPFGLVGMGAGALAGRLWSHHYLKAESKKHKAKLTKKKTLTGQEKRDSDYFNNLKNI